MLKAGKATYAFDDGSTNQEGVVVLSRNEWVEIYEFWYVWVGGNCRDLYIIDLV